MSKRITDLVKRNGEISIYLIIFLLVMGITIILVLKFYNFWVVFAGILAGIFSVFVPLVEKIMMAMGLEVPQFLEDLPVNVKKGIIVFCFGILFGSLIVIAIKVTEKNNNSATENKKEDEINVFNNSITENEEEEIYEINVLNDIEYNVNVGEIISIDINILTPESYKFETTPFILYSGYFDEEQWEWVQFGAFALSAGEENYCLHIDTKLLGLSTGSYMIAFDLFKSSDYAEGRSLASGRIQLNLSGEGNYYDNDIFERNIVTYEKITDVFVINGIAYKYDSEELTLSNIENDDLKKISKCKQLKNLQVTGDNLTDLEPLRHMYSLETLHISSKNLEDVTPIGELINLKNLSLGGSQSNGMGFSGKLADISPIENLTNLEILSISDCQIEDIEAVRKLSKLTLLWIYKTPVKDIEPIEELALLKDLRLHSNNISDISALENLEQLEYLTLTGNPIVEEQLIRLQECLPNCDILYR